MYKSCFPKEIEERITDEFLVTYRNMLLIEFDYELGLLGEPPTYWNFYQRFENSNGAKNALETACKIHKFMELYNYLNRLNYNEGKDELYGKIVEMMCERNVIKEGEIDTYSMECMRNYALLEEELEKSGMTFEQVLEMVKLIQKEDNSSAFGE